MSVYTTKNKDYTINMHREPVFKTGWAGQRSYKYLCNFVIADAFKEVFRFTMSEVDVLVMLDNFDELLSEDLFSTILATNIKTPDPNISVGLYITKVYNNAYLSTPTYVLEIYDCYENTKTSVKRVSIVFDEEELDKFTGLVYFTFLVDTEEGYLLTAKDYDEYNNPIKGGPLINKVGSW